MEILEPLSDFFEQIKTDPRISITHIGIYAALLQFWKEQDFQNPFYAYRQQIMTLSKITGHTTYSKCMKELGEYGYINYEPSYKRNRANKIRISCGANE